MLGSDEIYGECCYQILAGLSRAQANHYLSTTDKWVKFRHLFTGATEAAKEINYKQTD